MGGVARGGRRRGPRRAPRWSGSRRTAPWRSPTGSAAGCRCTTPGWGWCCSPTPTTRSGRPCSTRSAPAATTAPLRRRLADIRRRGVVVFDRSDPAPVASVAAPVRDATWATVAAVSIVVPAGGASPRAYEHVVSATARGVSRGLGPGRG
ncbi:IclR family transcriptional regulator domain-containing protein [Actinomycetospora sp. C-140]